VLDPLLGTAQASGGDHLHRRVIFSMFLTELMRPWTPLSAMGG
jgi:hypothetical protein